MSKKTLFGKTTGATLIAAALSLPAAAIAAEAEYKLGERLQQKSGAVTAGYKEVPWDALVPANWDPAKELGALDLSTLSDSDPRAIKALEKLKAAMDNAPVVPAINGSRVRIAGFMVPLDGIRGQITEFLLVPYFGACIHTPPPPSNQIIHVVPVKPYKTDQGMEAVWISGTIETVRAETGMGNAGYRMKAEVVTTYKR
ncbi:MAG: hypothetical protein JWO70_165 [Betaproteobacteria bacterium]|jgi:hypothetical protein|nr:hypothetical protein [Betaproteobacteria bacterium]